MNGFVSLHIEKLKSALELTKAYKHNYRIDNPLNADEEKKSENEELISLDGKTYLQAFYMKINSLPYYYDHSVRKNAVWAYEIIMSFPKEDMEHVNIDDWKKDSVDWLEATFNKDETHYGNNVISAVYHGDETDPHIHAIVIPIDGRGHLCSKTFDGPQNFRRMQDSYGKLMEEHHGLKRGQKYSVAKHEDVKRFYTHVNDAMAAELPPVEPGETAEAYKARNDEFFKDAMLAAYAKQLNGQKSAEEKASKYRAKVAELNKQYKELKSANHKLHMDLDMAYQETNELREDLEHGFGNLQELREKLNVLDALDYAIQNYPDRDFAEKTQELMNQMELWGTSELQKDQDKGE